MITVNKFYGYSLRTGILIYLVVQSVVTVWVIVTSLWPVLIYGNIFLGILTVINLISLVIYFLGIYGAVKKKPEYLTPFSVFLAVSIVVFISATILWPIAAVLFYSDLLAFFKLNKDIFLVLVIGIEIICLMGIIHGIYAFIAVLSFQNELKTQEADAAEYSV